MTTLIKTNDIRNVVEFKTQPIALLTKNGNELVFVVGSNNDETGEAFNKVVSGNTAYMIFRKLRINSKDALLAVSNLEENHIIKGKLFDMVKMDNCIMPSNYDFENRCAYRMNGDSTLKFTNASPFKYFKYLVSLLGNPKHVIVFKISDYDYKQSEFYKVNVKPLVTAQA